MKVQLDPQSNSVADPNNAAFQGVVAMTVGTVYAAQRSVGVNCTIGGTIVLILADGSTVSLPVSTGWQTFPFAATEVQSSTATAAYYNLK